MQNFKSLDEFFESMKQVLPEDLFERREEIVLDHLMKAINTTLRPNGDWLLMNGSLTIKELLTGDE